MILSSLRLYCAISVQSHTVFIDWEGTESTMSIDHATRAPAEPNFWLSYGAELSIIEISNSHSRCMQLDFKYNANN